MCIGYRVGWWSCSSVNIDSGDLQACCALVGVCVCAVPLCVRPLPIINTLLLKSSRSLGRPLPERSAAAAALYIVLCHQWWDQRRLFHYSALCQSLSLFAQPIQHRLLQIAFPDLLMQICNMQWETSQTNLYNFVFLEIINLTILNNYFSSLSICT